MTECSNDCLPGLNFQLIRWHWNLSHYLGFRSAVCLEDKFAGNFFLKTLVFSHWYKWSWGFSEIHKTAYNIFTITIAFVVKHGINFSSRKPTLRVVGVQEAKIFYKVYFNYSSIKQYIFFTFYAIKHFLLLLDWSIVHKTSYSWVAPIIFSKTITVTAWTLKVWILFRWRQLSTAATKLSFRLSDILSCFESTTHKRNNF